MRYRVALLATATAFLMLPAAASASFHLMKVSEVRVDPADPELAYVELQMYTAGQNQVAGHELKLYDQAGTEASLTLPESVPNGDSQRSILIGTPKAAAMFGADFDGIAPGSLEAAGGAVCFEAIDCVTWGSYGGSTPSAGSPAPAITGAASLTRTIAPGCATLLEDSDDSGDSATDFSLQTPTPRNNATTPTERDCSGPPDPGPGPDPDNSVDRATLTGKGTQKQRGKTPKIVLQLSAGEDVTVKVSAAIGVGRKTYKLRQNVTIAGGDRTKVVLKASGKAKKKINKALDRGKKLAAKVQAKFSDAAGNAAIERKTIKLK